MTTEYAQEMYAVEGATVSVLDRDDHEIMPLVVRDIDPEGLDADCDVEFCVNEHLKLLVRTGECRRTVEGVVSRSAHILSPDHPYAITVRFEQPVKEVRRHLASRATWNSGWE